MFCSQLLTEMPHHPTFASQQLIANLVPLSLLSSQTLDPLRFAMEETLSKAPLSSSVSTTILSARKRPYILTDLLVALVSTGLVVLIAQK